MRFQLQRALLALLPLLLLAGTAHGFSVRLSASNEVVRWPTPLVQYYIQYLGSDNLTSEESLLGVRRAFDSWVDVGCSALTFEELGDAPNPATSLLIGKVANGINEVVWVEDDSWATNITGQYTLAVTLPLHDSDTGHMIEADIVFNGYQYSWKLDSGGGTDLEGVALHEIGHMFGMQHNLLYDNVQPPTMAPYISGQNKSRTLELDDEMGVCFLYPADDYTCSDDAECPKVVGRDQQGNEFYTGAFPCTPDASDPENAPGTCGPFALNVTGIANLGEACPNQEACAAGFICTPLPDQNEDVCATACSVGSNDDCIEGFECVPFAIQPSTGACLPAGGEPFPPGNGPLGCIGGSSCAEGQQCIDTPRDDDSLKLCVSTCAADGSKVCPEGTECYFFSEGAAIGACFEPQHIYEDWGAEPELEPVPDEPEPEPEPMPEVAEAEPDAPEAVEPEPVVPATPSDGCGSGATPTAGLSLFLLLALGLARRRYSGAGG